MVSDQIQHEIQLTTNTENFSFCKQLRNDQDTLKLLIFFLITLIFAFIEFFFGYIANSLSLMSDSVHMLFDSTALAIAVYAQVKSKASPDILHSFGYERYKVLTGYINGIFLFFIAFYILIEAVDRLINPPQIMPNLILIVAIIGFIINLIGLFFFHGHSGLSSNHSHQHQHQHSQNSNLTAVFLHILADALGSVGVIISAFLIQQFKFYRSDPITSIIISCLIISSVIPLLNQSGKNMLLNYDKKHSNQLENLLQMFNNDSDIINFSDVHLWQIMQNRLIFSIKIICKKNILEEDLIKRIQLYITSFTEIVEITVQIDEESQDPNEQESLVLELGKKIFQSEDCAKIDY